MSVSIQRRLQALEGTYRGACLGCELARLAGTQQERCNHTARRTLRDEIVELDRTTKEPTQ